MIFVLPHFWIIFLDIFLWLVIHLGISYACSKIPIERFNPESCFYRPKSFERGGKLYTGFFRIKKWKNAVPDGAKLFRGGFPKKHLEQCSQEYLKTFTLETCRGELTHWLQILPAGIFFLWNIWWAGIIMIVYAICANVPCILLQRYNRARLMRVTARNDI